MTTAGIVLLVLGAGYCLLKKGTDWPVAIIFLAAGVAISQGAIGQVLTTVTNSLGTSLMQVLGQLTA
jgi:hypothetical protein